jgi:hypothetical protein
MIPNERADPRVVAERWTQALTAHDLEAAVACFAPDYHDEAPARRGEFIQGTHKVRENFAALFRDIADLCRPASIRGRGRHGVDGVAAARHPA